jgi:hypothetical protein
MQEFVAIAGAEAQRQAEPDPEKRKYPGGAFDPLGFSKDSKVGLVGYLRGPFTSIGALLCLGFRACTPGAMSCMAIAKHRHEEVSPTIALLDQLQLDDMLCVLDYKGVKILSTFRVWARYAAAQTLEVNKLKEIKNGRLAMLAFVGFVAQHAATGKVWVVHGFPAPHRFCAKIWPSSQAWSILKTGSALALRACSSKHISFHF